MTITIQVDKNRLVTLDEIMTDTCRTRERVAKTLPRDPCTVAEILAIESVSPSERIYQAVRFVDPRVAREFACRVTSAALTWTKTTDARSWDAIHTARRYVLGLATENELAAAAAWAAWTAAERVAAWAAAGRAASWKDSLALLCAMVEQVDRDGALTVELEQ